MVWKRDRILLNPAARAVPGNRHNATTKTASKLLSATALDRILLIAARKYCFISLLLLLLLLRLPPAADPFRRDQTGISRPVRYRTQSEAFLCAVPTTRTDTVVRAHRW